LSLGVPSRHPHPHTDATTAIWDTAAQDWIATLEGHEHEVKGAAFSPSGTFLATCSRDKSVWVWEVVAGQEGGEEAEFECVAVLQEHTQDVKRVLWHPKADVLASCSYDNDLRIWREVGGEEWACVQVLRGHTSTVWDADFSRDGAYLVSVSDDQSARLWAPSGPEGAWTCVQVLEQLHTRPIYSVSWSKGEDGLVLTAGADNTIHLLALDPNGPGLVLRHTLPQPHGPLDVNCVQWCPLHPGLFASCGDDHCTRIWAVSESAHPA
jgi:WD40 repeat protein